MKQGIQEHSKLNPYKEASSDSGRRNGCNCKASAFMRHIALVDLCKIARRVQFERNQRPALEGQHELSVIHGALQDGLLARRDPFRVTLV